LGNEDLLSRSAWRPQCPLGPSARNRFHGDRAASTAARSRATVPRLKRLTVRFRLRTSRRNAERLQSRLRPEPRPPRRPAPIENARDHVVRLGVIWLDVSNGMGGGAPSRGWSSCWGTCRFRHTGARRAGTLESTSCVVLARHV